MAAAAPRRKPDTRTAMRRLIGQVRAALPFESPAARLCDGACNGCSVKLLEFLEAELSDWEQRLGRGERPDFGDLARLAKTSRKVHRVLVRNGVVEPELPHAE
ncbi:hypothetical protein F2Q65_05955 [Thiohalocapsa marina]|uniref:Uncharacterized protein n=1 Tax=Thiohalocapsa marina TaxID=424902 RepID=A0A5M8FQW6_9GAMM|nr:hypothetical protein [Thiohalocapsa marina]KAA6186336.1 hypothetical protein F2Q65_05955 [Thiohalocapsa marina]